MKHLNSILILISLIALVACSPTPSSKSAADILGNPEYLAMSFGGYREPTRDIVPTVEQLKEDMRLLSAMGVKLIRTYNTQQFGQAKNLLKAIDDLKKEDASFEMYVMLGTWIECQGAWTDNPDHSKPNVENNMAELNAAVEMVNQYPDIVKIIAVGNEAMVQWAVGYFVEPEIVLDGVNYLKDLRTKGEIPAETWITSSDNYESWGGGSNAYDKQGLVDLLEAVDFVSLHTYPFHDSHYNPAFWAVPKEEMGLNKLEQIENAMIRAKDYAHEQYIGAKTYMESKGISKPIHIGETGWATIAASSYGATGSKAADEYKEKLYYELMREWTAEEGMSCFYFEAFDERWKDSRDSLGSENHFGLIKLNGQAKYALWDWVDEGRFDGLIRDGKSITKTYSGDEAALMAEVLNPPTIEEVGILEITTKNETRAPGAKVEEAVYVLTSQIMDPSSDKTMTFPNSNIKLNAWEGTCGIEMDLEGVITVTTGTGEWWGSALELMGKGEDLSAFKNGKLHFEIKGDTRATFNMGFQTGTFAGGDQVNNGQLIGPNKSVNVSESWTKVSLSLSALDNGANWKDVTAPLFFLGDSNFDGKEIQIKNIYYTID